MVGTDVIDFPFRAQLYPWPQMPVLLPPEPFAKVPHKCVVGHLEQMGASLRAP
jgi:hypothetical protein